MHREIVYSIPVLGDTMPLSTGDIMPLITGGSSMGMQENWATTLYFLRDKFARFLYEFHAFRFESLDLPPLPADRSDFDVHGALDDEQIRVPRLLQYLSAILVSYRGPHARTTAATNHYRSLDM